MEIIVVLEKLSLFKDEADHCMVELDHEDAPGLTRTRLIACFVRV
jgi:hypothetical protein